MEKYPNRKPTRLTAYDYSTPGVYFVTICTKDRVKILCDVAPTLNSSVGEGLCALPRIELTTIGKMVEKSIHYIHTQIPGFLVDHYVIMPNHIHLLVKITASSETGGHGGPPLHKIIGQFKSYTTHQYGHPLWQRSYHDHIIRGEQDYNDVWQYMDNNPARWQEDRFYTP